MCFPNWAVIPIFHMEEEKVTTFKGSEYITLSGIGWSFLRGNIHLLALIQD